ncbi:arsenate reductase [Amylibacter sp. SFDW26]|uniref:ArsC/Spx/MgsR family protein n=1 Tax=Amylibacter sp. SFDW26 TaxID=2652722 RepID=UPI00126143C4|nr:ArsC/Spx/MgsR family protein [Amylibacter sp. SFDW26]KAB7616386.1 arsenate reductase [Amylibacter sp. SFDW26]
MTLYGLKTCDTCKKALKSLSAAGHEVTYVDVRADGVAPAKLAEFQGLFGDALTNTRSTTWRGLDETQRARPALELIAENPTLMKRPVIETANGSYLGWGKDVQAQFED